MVFKRGSSNVNRPFRIVLEGNIGSGKSRALEFFAKELGLPWFDEQVSACPSLGLFYEDKKKYAYQLQMEILDSYEYAPERGVIVRSPAAGQYVFTQHLREGGFISDKEYWSIRDRVESLWVPDLFVFFDAPPETCWSRIQNRGLPSDKHIELEDLQALHEKYKDLMAWKLADGEMVYPLSSDKDETPFRELLRKVAEEIREEFLSGKDDTAFRERRRNLPEEIRAAAYYAEIWGEDYYP